MKILYIAKHGSGGGDDEGAIAHALRQLGHEVDCQPEDKPDPEGGPYAFLLFHKLDDPWLLGAMKGMVRVFWYFDLVNFPSDPSLARRCRTRMDWMRRITPLVDVGFCTDGDWVAEDQNEKLVWLPQGADERIVGRHEQSAERHPGPPICFYGISKGGGRVRESFVSEMRERYGRKFHHVERGVYGLGLARAISAAKVVVAPDGPVTDCYWSNRVYNVLGFGGFLLHPKCHGLLAHYTSGQHYIRYDSRKELFEFLDYYSSDLCGDEVRMKIGEAGLAETKARHLYRHRCEVLIRTLRERGLVP